ncbi:MULTISPECIES: helix-turn-helix domain-containing protein [Lysinibacillus]|uniref:helix-turn-helix domain-containing protein n=1 Tax=Lysinibacillus TaxID=400634 RepID=UPI001C8B7DE3|nr:MULTISPECIES: helix-turn-helix domain-containing protein [Lysinibacillus]MBX8944949.1 helix-turn-helix domain-containing protein [Lysinibacillus sp. K60]
MTSTFGPYPAFAIFCLATLAYSSLISNVTLLHLKDAGKSNREIARLFGVSEATIRRRLKENKSEF